MIDPGMIAAFRLHRAIAAEAPVSSTEVSLMNILGRGQGANEVADQNE